VRIPVVIEPMPRVALHFLVAAGCLLEAEALGEASGGDVTWLLAQAGANCNQACASSGGTCENRYWPTDTLEMARVAISTKTQCVNILKATASQTFIPSYVPTVGSHSCYYSTTGAGSTDSCAHGPRQVEESSHRRFCPCRGVRTTSVLVDASLPSIEGDGSSRAPPPTTRSLLGLLSLVAASAGVLGGLVVAGGVATWRLAAVGRRHAPRGDPLATEE